MNVTELTNALHTKINSSTNLDQILLLSKAVERLKLGNVNVVTNFSELSAVDFDFAAYGALYFVETQNQLYVSSGPGVWISILRSNDIVAYGWGSNGFGQIGDRTVANKSSPVSVVGGFTDWTQLTSGRNFSLGIRANGTAWAWGNNNYGRLGDNTTIDKSSPVSVVGGFTDWTQVSAGDDHTLGIRANGTAWAWGLGTNGKLGDGTTVSKLSPISVIGGFADWIQVSAGGYHSLGLRADNTLWAWGSNNFGQLGNNTTVNTSSPISVIGYTDWTQISAATNHSLGLRSDGTLWAWGTNFAGVLGDGTTTARSSPVSVIGGFTDWTQISASGNFNFAIRANGTLWGWGFNTIGYLGDNTNISKRSPVSVVGGFNDWVQVSAGGSHGLGLRANGTAWTWGSGANGRLGDNTTVAKSSPVSIAGGFTDWIQVSASGPGYHSLAIRNNNRL